MPGHANLRGAVRACAAIETRSVSKGNADFGVSLADASDHDLPCACRTTHRLIVKDRRSHHFTRGDDLAHPSFLATSRPTAVLLATCPEVSLLSIADYCRRLSK